MAAIQIPTNIIDERLSKLEHDLKDANIVWKTFNKTRELGFLFDLARIIRNYYTNEYYFLRTELDSVQTRRLRVLLNHIESIEYHVNIEINKLSKCKV